MTSQRLAPGEAAQALLAAALWYAAHGVHVFPCFGVSRRNGEWRCDCGEPDCEHGGKHPIGAAVPHGWQDATTDADTIRRWWAAYPNANIAEALGLSASFVLDVDGPEGKASLNGREVPVGPCVETGKGHHHHYRHDHKAKPLKGKVGFLPGLDARSAGNYVLLPPSRHISGKQYRWVEGLSPKDVDLPPVPGWIVEELTKGAAAARRTDGPHIPKGQRHDVLTSLAGTMRRRGMTEAAILAALREERAARCEEPETVTDRELAEIARDAMEWPPEEVPTRGVQGAARPSAADSFRLSGKWPAPLAPAAFHGLAGDLVRMIEPHTEADPAALLLQFLVAFGNVIGRSAHFVADGAEHCTNLYVELVGETAKGRKGTSLARVRRPLESVDSAWASDCVKQGLSSGEGLIWQVRDPIEEEAPVRERGRVVDYQTVIVDAGVKDKRLLITETEFASALRVMRREGNTLSPVLRMAWDTGNLSTLTKNSPARAAGAHVSVIGHITLADLRQHFDDTERANGFGNRFLWACVRRSKVLPEGGQIHKVDFAAFELRLSEAVEFARGVGEMTRDGDARTLWYEVYPALSEGHPGLLGAVIARAEAQVMRLACIYALLDKSAVIRRGHLEAALAVWRYCEDSARFIFGQALGEPLADEILRLLRGAENGLTRWEINNALGRNRNAAQITRALNLLAEHGLARCEKDASGPGRPTERWWATQPRPPATSRGYEVNEGNEETPTPGAIPSSSSFSSYPDGVAEQAPAAVTTCCECGSPRVSGRNRKDGRDYCLPHWHGNDADRVLPDETLQADGPG